MWITVIYENAGCRLVMCPSFAVMEEYSELSRTALLCCRLALLAITKYIYDQSEKEFNIKAQNRTRLLQALRGSGLCSFTNLQLSWPWELSFS